MNERVKEYEERALVCLSFNAERLTDALYSDSLETWVADQLHYHENGFDDYTLPIDEDLAEKLEEIAKEVAK
jgi:hypothetical protein